MRYISAVADDHRDSSDDEAAFNVFAENSDADGKVNKDKAQYAYERVFELWDVDLTGPQETEFYAMHFEPLWNKYAKDSLFPDTPEFATLKLKDAVKFLHEMTTMTTGQQKQALN